MAALEQVAESGKTELPFTIYDCRDPYELEIYDLAESINVTATL